jgi:hypothetical protein
LNKKVAVLGLVNGDLQPWDRDADHVTSLYPPKVGTTSPIGGGCSVGIVRTRTVTPQSFSCLPQAYLFFLSVVLFLGISSYF